MANITVDQLLNMPWELIKIKKYEQDLYDQVWANDADIQYLTKQNNFIYDFDCVNNAFKKCTFEYLLGYSYRLAMEQLLNQIYLVNYHSLSETTPVKDAIKLIKANLLAALLISSSIEKVFKSFQFNKQHWTFKGEIVQLIRCKVFDTALISCSDTPLQYNFSIRVNGVNHNSLTGFAITVCNWWATRMNPNDTIKDIARNHINIEANIHSLKQNIALNSTVEDFPKAIKAAIVQIL